MELALQAGQEAIAALALLAACAFAVREAWRRRRHIYNSGSAASMNGRRATGRA